MRELIVFLTDYAGEIRVYHVHASGFGDATDKAVADYRDEVGDLRADWDNVRVFEGPIGREVYG